MKNPYIKEERHLEIKGNMIPVTDEALMEELEGFSERLFKFGKYLQKNTTVTPDLVFDNKGDKVFDVIFCEIAKKHGISSEEVRESLRTTTGNIISSASATLFIPDTTSTFLGRKQYFTRIWKLLSIQHTAHFF